MIPLLAFAAFFGIFLAWNTFLILVLKRSPNHAVQQLLRSGVWITIACIIKPDWRDKVMYAISFHLAFGFPFDLFLNKLRGKEWLYIGDTAWTDQLGRQWPGAFWPMKFILFVMGMGTLIFGTFL